jgi:cellulose biosynthesis protein BcsQ
MLSTLRSKFDFRYIVIDTDCIVGNILQKLITQSDKLVFVSSGSDISLDKFNRIKRYLNIIERKTDLEMPKNYILFNQYYGSEDVEAFTRDMTVVARLARYRTDDNSHITSQKIIDVVLGKGDVFANLK